MRIAALVKQIPKFEQMTLGPDGRLERDGLELHMNDYCRRAVRKGCDLAAQTGGTCTAITLGPPEAHTVLREAILCGCVGGIHVTDPAFAGSDTLATAKALAAALEAHGPFDLILCGRNSLDADTGQVPPEVAALLGLPFATGVRTLEIGEGTLEVGLEHDDEWVEATVRLPALVSCAERLCDPCKIKDPEQWATVDAALIDTTTAADLGEGPWGQAGSPTSVGNVRTLVVDRAQQMAGSVDDALAILADRGVSGGVADTDTAARVPEPADTDRRIIVVVEPDRELLARELLGAAAELGGRVTAIGPDLTDAELLGSWGADEAIEIIGASTEVEVAAAVTEQAVDGWALLAPGTAWGREVASRVAVSHNAGLTGDAVGLEVRDGQLVALKPAFGGSLVAEISCSSKLQMATVRPGVLDRLEPRSVRPVTVEQVAASPTDSIVIHERKRNDDSDALATADIVIGVGQGVDPGVYPELERLAEQLGATLSASRKVTDAGWMPRSRQVGITGHSISPSLFIAIGTSGKFNHLVGVRGAGTVVGINPDRNAPLWGFCDVGLVGDWAELLPQLVSGLSAGTRG